MKIWEDFSSQAGYKFALIRSQLCCGGKQGMNMRNADPILVTNQCDCDMKFIKGVIRSKV